MIAKYIKGYSDIGQMFDTAQESHRLELLSEIQGSLIKAKTTGNLNIDSAEANIQSVNDLKLESRPLEEVLAICSKSKAESHRIQMYINAVEVDRVRALYALIKPHLMKLSYDQYANYIIQALIEKLPESRQEFSQEFLSKRDEMLRNQYASRVLQKMVQYRDNEFT